MKIEVSKEKLFQFGILVGIGFPLIFGFLVPILFGHSFRIWTVLIGLPLTFLSFLYPKSLKIPYLIWMKIGFLLGWVNSKLILGGIFIFILIPISIIMRIFKYDPLLSISYKQKTYKI